MDFRNFREIDWQLFFIRAYTWVLTVSALVSTQTVKSVKYLAASFTPEIYVLYTGSSIPVRSADYNKDVAGASNIDFYYNRETKVISKTLESSHLPRTLNIEGASIYHGDICLYDLTDFFDTTRFAGGQDVPTLDQWVGIWELENGIYLDRNKEFQLQIDFLGAGHEEFTLWVKHREERWRELISNAPRLHRQTMRALALPDCSCVSSATEAVAEPVAEAVAEPVAEAVAEPVAEAVAEPVAEPVAEAVSTVSRSMAWDETSSTWREVTDLSGNLVDLSGNTAPVAAVEEGEVGDAPEN
jgi:hypothetical protein